MEVGSMVVYLISSLYVNGHEVDEGSIYDIGRGARYHIIKIEGPVYQRYKDELMKEGIKIYDYLPGNGFIEKKKTHL
ncbi:MAG: hypothetical protein N2504_07255, partial [candidate division WOR-3 bacterium]|nr:hypothetical protein [candidate division WOR-3 bacterium]